MSQSPEPVTVRIVDREYRVMCTPDQRRTLMESALFLDQQMREIRDSGKVSSMDKIAVMAALNLAEEVLKLRQQMHDRRDQVDSRVRDLADRLDRALEQD
ncbi:MULTISPECIES: cell division protein ZapA [unclassified Wenzhouxiangella]|uniref:cell division protein ZapA n=1 Tax=unclassified Wenzhouxiangella TaxID=2613841 RepID=UPI000E328975|nr:MULTISPECIES: cell division protein ZapA [unclassified Wenzhouxiangella]RFF26619.1 cell division protein ZapA [Wenzhouxiangella sp. 15181]RFP67631.1 cell division protein ZapA [Wenzhouxiangella sp. 15190]